MPGVFGELEGGGEGGGGVSGEWELGIAGVDLLCSESFGIVAP